MNNLFARILNQYLGRKMPKIKSEEYSLLPLILWVAEKNSFTLDNDNPGNIILPALAEVKKIRLAERFRDVSHTGM